MQFVDITWQSDTYQSEIELRESVLRKPLGLTFTDEDLVDEASQLHFGIEKESRLIACVVAVRLPGALVKLRQMAVEPTHQRKGVGSLLIRSTETRLSEMGVRSIELNAREPVVQFYEHLGYQPEGERFVEVTIPHQKMVKKLRPH